MSRTSQSLWTILLTYVLIHLLYFASGFDPLRSFPNILGRVLDFGAWLLVYLVVFLALGILARRPEPS